MLRCFLSYLVCLFCCANSVNALAQDVGGLPVGPGDFRVDRVDKGPSRTTVHGSYRDATGTRRRFAMPGSKGQYWDWARRNAGKAWSTAKRVAGPVGVAIAADRVFDEIMDRIGPDYWPDTCSDSAALTALGICQADVRVPAGDDSYGVTAFCPQISNLIDRLVNGPNAAHLAWGRAINNPATGGYTGFRLGFQQFPGEANLAIPGGCYDSSAEFINHLQSGATREAIYDYTKGFSSPNKCPSADRSIVRISASLGSTITPFGSATINVSAANGSTFTFSRDYVNLTVWVNYVKNADCDGNTVSHGVRGRLYRYVPYSVINPMPFDVPDFRSVTADDFYDAMRAIEAATIAIADFTNWAKGVPGHNWPWGDMDCTDVETGETRKCRPDDFRPRRETFNPTGVTPDGTACEVGVAEGEAGYDEDCIHRDCRRGAAEGEEGYCSACDEDAELGETGYCFFEDDRSEEDDFEDFVRNQFEEPDWPHPVVGLPVDDVSDGVNVPDLVDRSSSSCPSGPTVSFRIPPGNATIKIETDDFFEAMCAGADALRPVVLFVGSLAAAFILIKYL